MSDQPETTYDAQTVDLDAPDHSVPTFGRRTVLRAAGVAGAGAAAAGALAACGGSSTPSTGSGGAAAASTSSGSSNAAGGGSSSAAAGGLSVKSADVPVGGGVINGDQLFVVTQPSAGQFKAFSAVCTHMGCTVDKVEGGFIKCPCHQSQFDIATGTPTSSSQAKKALPAKTATVNGDSVVIA